MNEGNSFAPKTGSRKLCPVLPSLIHAEYQSRMWVESCCDGVCLSSG